MAGLLEVINLRAFYGATQVLYGLDIALEDGGITAILGANGAGKTTTLRAISGLIRTLGEIRFEGHRIDGDKTEAIARRGIAHVPDGRGTIRQLTIAENLRLGAHTRRDRHNVARDLDLVYGYFPRLKERLKQQAGTLSGGEQQMLAISRALMMRPKLLLLDEPSFGLAPLVVLEIFEIMRTINRQHKVSMLLVEQNASLALELAGRAYLLETGRVVLSGTSRQMELDPAVRRSYLGY
ncbi:MAG: ABC transporter ATP-binding protein [Xanthobacteraceae bacterium]